MLSYLTRRGCIVELQKYDAAYGDLDFAAKAGADNL
jgi:hypothetical protein